MIPFARTFAAVSSKTTTDFVRGFQCPTITVSSPSKVKYLRDNVNGASSPVVLAVVLKGPRSMPSAAPPFHVHEKYPLACSALHEWQSRLMLAHVLPRFHTESTHKMLLKSGIVLIN